MADALAALGWVALGGAIGGPFRFFVSGIVGRRVGETFPWGTFAVNVSGAFVIGLISEPLAQAPLGAGWQFAVVGVLGSYTTVSSFSLQTLALARDGQARRATANVIISLAGCLAAVAMGAGVARAFL